MSALNRGAWLALPALTTAILMLALLFTSQAHGQSLEDPAEDLLHSDLPLFGQGGDNEWPQHYSDAESFGCMSHIGFGDWVFRRHRADGKDDELWYRFSNYGAFHCWANAGRAYERARLDSADEHPSFFVLFGTTAVDGKELELWAIQIGARPGSDYVLLSRTPTKGTIENFNVLQTECPRGSVRDGGSLDILLTRYCAVRSRGDLVSLARRMAKRPPLGTLARIPDGEETGDKDVE